MPGSIAAAPLGVEPMDGGRRGKSVKTLKKMLKKAGLKTSGKKAALTRRAKKARLTMGGGKGGPDEMDVDEGGGRRRRSRKSRGFKLY